MAQIRRTDLITRKPYESHDFWFDLEEEKEKHWWSLFRRFAVEMKQIEQDISLGREIPDKWKFKF